MKTSDFPLAMALFSVERTDRSGKVTTGSPRRLTNLESALAVLDKGERDDSILNPVWIEAKSSVGYFYQDLWENFKSVHNNYYGWNRSYYNGSDLTKRDAANELDQLLPSEITAHNNAGLVKRMEKCLVKVSKIIDVPSFFYDAIALMKEFQPLADVINDLKGKVVKRQPKSEEEKAAKYTPPAATTNASKMVLDFLNKIVAEKYQELLSARIERSMGWMEKFNDAVKAAGEAGVSYDDLNDRRNREGALVPGIFGGQTTPVFAIRMVTASPPWTRERKRNAIVLAPGAKEKLTAMATRESEEIRDAFLFKNMVKIASIVDSKGTPSAARIIGRGVSLEGLTGRLRFEFPDGASFEVQNSCVLSYSVHGKAFLRFPLTFHDVKLAGGVKMPSPSQERMNTVFTTVVAPEA